MLCSTGIVCAIPPRISCKPAHRSNSSSYAFRQNSNVLYLTGLNQPNVIALFHRNRASRNRFILFTEQNDPAGLLWNGPKTDSSSAVEYFEADEAYEIGQLEMFIRQSSVPQNRIFRDQDENSCSPGSGHSEIDQLVQHLRVVKDDHEVKLLQEASDVAAAAFNEAIGYSKVGMCENELAAKFQFSCIRDGADMLAYTPVVASGSQALVIHYIQNRHLLRTDELVLMDAGAYYHGYNTDVTRTWSPGRNYSEPQLELYLVMLELQKDCIRRCVSNGVESLDTLHSYCVDELVLRLNQKLKFNVDKEVCTAMTNQPFVVCRKGFVSTQHWPLSGNGPSRLPGGFNGNPVRHQHGHHS